MEAPMLKRRLNPFLLVSTVLILSLLAGLSVLYQGQLDNVVSDKKSLKQELQDKNAKVAELQSENSNLSQELSQKSDSLANLRKVRDSLEETLNATEEELADVKAERNHLEDHAEALNSSMALICAEDDNNLTATSNDQCTKWGYDR